MLKKTKNDHGIVWSYDAVAGEYYDPVRHPTCRNFREASAQLFARYVASIDLVGKIVCDFGAGDSVLAELLADQSHQIETLCLVDASMQMLSYSNRYRQFGAQLVAGKAEQMPLATGCLDFMFASLGDPYNTDAFWREVSRVLRPGAQCYFTTPSVEWATHYRSHTPQERRFQALFELKGGQHVYVPSYIYTEHEQRALIEGYGLKVTGADSVVLSELGSVASPKLRRGDSDGRTPVVSGFSISKPMSNR